MSNNIPGYVNKEQWQANTVFAIQGLEVETIRLAKERAKIYKAIGDTGYYDRAIEYVKYEMKELTDKLLNSK